jgi:hypothetical protein
MEKQFLPDSTFLDCMQLHNHIKDLYKFVLQPQRNSLCFNNNYDDTIITKQIKEKINFLKNIGFRFDNICNIRTTEYSWYLDYSGTYETINDNLLSDPTLKYLCINGVILKSDYMIEYIRNKKILYNPHSFRQSDDSIKYQIYDILEHNILNKNIYFIGGCN